MSKINRRHRWALADNIDLWFKRLWEKIKEIKTIENLF